MSKKEKVCSVCGDKFYAKGYCRKHYARFKNNGDPNINLKKRVRVDDVVGGYKIIDEEYQANNRRLVVKCERCGVIKVMGASYFSRTFSKKPCPCIYDYVPRTRKQKATIDMWISNGYSVSITADQLGISKQCVSKLIKDAREWEW